MAYMQARTTNNPITKVITLVEIQLPERGPGGLGFGGLVTTMLMPHC